MTSVCLYLSVQRGNRRHPAVIKLSTQFLNLAIRLRLLLLFLTWPREFTISRIQATAF